MAPTAGESGVPGDPGALRGAAASFGGASGHLGGLAADLTGATPGAWHGPASVACAALLRTLAHDVRTGADAFRLVAQVLQRLADDIEVAQREAAAALEAAATADGRANGLAQASSLTEDPPPAMLIARLHDEATGQRERALAAREAAREAGLTAAGLFATAAAMAPSPPPPPPAPKSDDGGGGIGGFFSGAWNTIKSAPGAAKDAYDSANHWVDDRENDLDGLVHSATSHLPGPLQDIADDAWKWSPMSPRFNIDFAQGVGDWGVGLVQAAPMLVRLSPTYGMIDPSGQAEQYRKLGDGLSYAWHHPGDMAKQMTGWNHVENGEPGRMAGQLAPDIALAILTGGGSAGVSASEKAATATAKVAEVADAADGASKLSRAEHLVNLERQASEAGVPMPTAGMRVHRTYGQFDVGHGVLDGSGPFGESWTPQPIEGIEHVRAELGLPHFNAGRFVISGTLDDPAAVTEIRRALPWNVDDLGYHMPGGGSEYLIPHAEDHITPLEVKGVNPDF